MPQQTISRIQVVSTTALFITVIRASSAAYVSLSTVTRTIPEIVYDMSFNYYKKIPTTAAYPQTTEGLYQLLQNQYRSF